MPCTPTQAAGCMNTVPGVPGIAQTLPHGFQGNPVPMNWRARSDSTQHPASSAARRQPGTLSRASVQGTATNSAISAAKAGTASGTSHQYRAASTRIASVIQYSPTRKFPQPNQKPRRNAASGPGAPSISVSSAGTEISSTGMANTGGSAAAASTPNPNAARSARQPRRPRILPCSPASLFKRPAVRPEPARRSAPQPRIPPPSRPSSPATRR